MSETGNPARYLGTEDGRADGAFFTLEGKVRAMEDVPKDETPIVAFVMFSKSEQRDWPAELISEVESLTIVQDAFQWYEGNRPSTCASEELSESGWDGEWPECHEPVVVLLNGWSAGPTPFCQQHLDQVLEAMGDDGCQWKPVRTTGKRFREWMVMKGCGPLWGYWPELEGKDPATAF